MHNPTTPHKEPEEVFLPLNPSRYAEFYSLEMDNYSRDIHFYLNNIRKSSKVLELGCGTGRISRELSKSGIHVTGLDLSHEMLKQAYYHNTNGTDYVCMDMCQMAFTQHFDHIIIPYNTLNLLKSESKIAQCLRQVHYLLAPGGTLLFQIYIPERNLLNKSEKLFQFQIFSLPEDKGKLVKESIRSFSSDADFFSLEERYRVRPNAANSIKEDFNHTFQLACFSFDKWISIIESVPFKVTTLLGDYSNRSFNKVNDPLLLAIVSK
jgi:ubiquinone/menaquinone biosynthesis C-methylase UbiE